MGLLQRIRFRLLDMAHDDGPDAPKPGNWHKHHDLLERIAYGELFRKPPHPATGQGEGE